MPFIWKPAIYKGSTLTTLPRPVNSLEITSDWDWRESKVPMLDGIETDGHSANGTEIIVQGQLGNDGSGTLLTSELLMMNYLKDLSDELDVSGASDKYEFFSYHDSGSNTYRKWSPCVTRSFKYNIGDDNRVPFTYTLVVFCESHQIQVTSPGS